MIANLSLALLIKVLLIKKPCILKQIYDETEANTNIPKQQMRDVLLLCTKNVHFSYNGDIYTQTDGVAMSSPLGQVLAGKFVVELQRTILSTLREHMSQW